MTIAELDIPANTEKVVCTTHLLHSSLVVPPLHALRPELPLSHLHFFTLCLHPFVVHVFCHKSTQAAGGSGSFDPQSSMWPKSSNDFAFSQELGGEHGPDDFLGHQHHDRGNYQQGRENRVGFSEGQPLAATLQSEGYVCSSDESRGETARGARWAAVEDATSAAAATAWHGDPNHHDPHRDHHPHEVLMRLRDDGSRKGYHSNPNLTSTLMSAEAMEAAAAAHAAEEGRCRSLGHQGGGRDTSSSSAAGGTPIGLAHQHVGGGFVRKWGEEKYSHGGDDDAGVTAAAAAAAPVAASVPGADDPALVSHAAVAAATAALRIDDPDRRRSSGGDAGGVPRRAVTEAGSSHHLRDFSAEARADDGVDAVASAGGGARGGGGGRGDTNLPRDLQPDSLMSVGDDGRGGLGSRDEDGAVGGGSGGSGGGMGRDGGLGHHVVGSHDEEFEEEELESFDLRVVYAKGRTGFQESKAFDWPEGSLVAGRYEVCWREFLCGEGGCQVLRVPMRSYSEASEFVVAEGDREGERGA